MLHFTTSIGDRYTVNEKGQIGRTRANGRWAHTPGPGWTMVGIAHTGPGFRWGKLALRFDQLTPAVVKATQWRYRTTGTPRFTVVDLDHGTRRTWGNKAHGIRSMWYAEDCPECHSENVHRMHQSDGHEDTRGRWVCGDCGLEYRP